MEWRLTYYILLTNMARTLPSGWRLYSHHCSSIMWPLLYILLAVKRTESFSSERHGSMSSPQLGATSSCLWGIILSLESLCDCLAAVLKFSSTSHFPRVILSPIFSNDYYPSCYIFLSTKKRVLRIVRPESNILKNLPKMLPEILTYYASQCSYYACTMLLSCQYCLVLSWKM